MTEQPVRHTADTITDDELDQLYARAQQAEARLTALKRAHVALAEQAGRDQGAIARARATCDRIGSIARAALGTPVSDYDRALHRAATLIRSVLDGPKEPTP